MAPATEPVVGLWAHRWDDLAERTGVGRYALEVTSALGDLRGPVRYERRGGRSGGATTGPLPLRRSWPPRRLLHASWLATGRPLLERVSPPVDLLHVLFPSFPVPTRTALVGTVNDLIALDHPEWYAPAEHRAVVASIRRLADRADLVIAISRHVADQVVQRLGVAADRVAVVHLGTTAGLDPDGPAEALPSGRPFVLAVGAQVERKNLGVLVRAIGDVEGMELVLAGPQGPATPSIHRLAADLGVSARVHHLGSVDQDRLQRLLRGASALAHPALDEGFGLPPLEAMASGTPVLAARAGALPEVVGDAATLLDPHDVDAWAGAISTLRDDEDLRAAMAADGLRHAAGRTWAHTAAATAALHERVLRAHGRL